MYITLVNSVMFVYGNWKNTHINSKNYKRFEYI